MALIFRSGPSVEPVSVSEAKAHLRLETDGDDTLVASLILTSRLHIEQALGLALITQEWTYVRDRWPRGGELILPLRPVQAVSAARIFAADGTFQLLDAADYLLDGQGTPARLIAAEGTWPVPGRAAQGIEIDIRVGFGDAASDVPRPIRQALLLLVAHWYEHRDPIEIGSLEAAIPSAVSELLMPYRVERL